jgi:GT2 family glycosyltransferase
MKFNLDVSVIIVSYNTIEMTKQCLHSIYLMTRDINFEVIVSDNGSTDGSVEIIKSEFQKVILIENRANLGFGAANNKALRIAQGKYIFYLNSDTLLLNNAVKKFFDFWETYPEQKKLGAIGANLLNEDREIIHSGGRFPTYVSLCREQLTTLCVHFIKSIIKFGRLYLLFPEKSKCTKSVKPIYGNIDYITGADLFMRNDENALFDERFFLYYEETDLELRLDEKGLKRLLIDGPQIVHLTKKRKSGYPISGIANVYNQLSAIIYTEKNLNIKPRFLSFLIRCDWLNPYIYKYSKPFLRDDVK